MQLLIHSILSEGTFIFKVQITSLQECSLSIEESEMQINMGFRPRGGGVMEMNYTYTAKDYDYRYCTETAGCVCFIERLIAGCVSYEELLHFIITGVHLNTLTKRNNGGHLLAP